ncbi:MAG: argininosuccinate lyase, partial [Candidatus Omnitrophica bacterium]|nr:argininosuccinate lyase [Candidatus Omnitrophota bacterium]
MTKKLWGGGYRRATSPTIERFTSSIAVDQRLALDDLQGSRAHAQMLGRRRIIPKAAAARLVRGLEAVRRDWVAGKIAIDPSAEDIHSVLHAALERAIGPAAQYLHTARSRNDQVITDTRLYGVRAARQGADSVRKLQRAIVQTAAKHAALIVPGYTHLQHAQPVLWAHWLLSYCEALERDRQRLRAAADRLDELPLGSGALTGTSFPVDRVFVAKQLGFARVSANSMDAVTDRDGPLEVMSALVLLGIHLSRIAEDLLLWVHSDVGFLTLDERLCTGSSMMPQKQNPDFLELTRAECGTLIGTLTGFLTVCKALPSGYNRDLQVDKAHLFRAVVAATGMLAALTDGFHGLTVQRDR